MMFFYLRSFLLQMNRASRRLLFQSWRFGNRLQLRASGTKVQRQPSVKDEGFFSKATKMKLLAGGCVATVAGSGYAYHQWNTDVEFRIEWTIYLTELVYGPQPGASPFTVEDLTIGDDLRTCLGRVFLAIDLKESSGFSKLQCLEFVDNIGFDVRNTLALSDLWLDQLLRPIGFEKLRLEYRLRQEEESGIVVHEPSDGWTEERRAASKRIELCGNQQRQYKAALVVLHNLSELASAAQADADAAWHLFGLGSRNSKLKLAEKAAGEMKVAKERVEEAAAACERSWAVSETIGLDEFLTLVSRLRDETGESDETLLSRMRSLPELQNAMDSDEDIFMAGGYVSQALSHCGREYLAAQGHKEPQPSQELAQELAQLGKAAIAEVDVSEREMIEHELRTLRERRERLELELKGREEENWSSSQRRELGQLKTQEMELQEELKACR